jgi:hypothetical protein
MPVCSTVTFRTLDTIVWYIISPPHIFNLRQVGETEFTRRPLARAVQLPHAAATQEVFVDLEVLKKKISTFRGEGGRVRIMSEDLLMEILLAWEQ